MKPMLCILLIIIAVTTLSSKEIKCTEINTIALYGNCTKPIIHNENQKYRISGDSLFIVRSDNSEYYYNDLKEVDHNRYVSGNKFLVFTNENKTSLKVTHIDDMEVKLKCFKCRK